MKEKRRGLKVAVVGVGYIAQKVHIPAWKKLADVVALVDTDIQKAREVAKVNGVKKTFASLEEIAEIDQKHFDIIDVCTPPESHADLAIKAMTAGCHVVVEKPMCLSSEEADKMILIACKSRVNLWVCHDYLFWPTLMKADAQYRRGKIGQINSILIKHFEWSGNPRISNEGFWYHKLKGDIFDHILPHSIYVAMNFLGNLEVVRVETSKLSSVESLPFDELSLLLKSEKGQFADILMSCNSSGGFVEIDIFGDKANLRVGTSSTFFYKGEGKGNPVCSSVNETLNVSSTIAFSLLPRLGNRLRGYSSHYFLFKKFIEAIERGDPSLVPFLCSSKGAKEVIRIIEQVNARLP